MGNRLVDNNRMSVLTTTSSSDDAGAFGILVHGDDNDISANTISGSDAFSYDYGRDGAAVEIYGGIGNRIHHNVAVDNDAFTELGDPRSANNTFAYNLVRSSLDTSTFLVTRGASSSYGPVLGTSVYNNTVVMTGASSQGFICHAGCSASILSLKNNIIQAVAKVGYADAPFDEGYNVYSGGQRQFTVGQHVRCRRSCVRRSRLCQLPSPLRESGRGSRDRPGLHIRSRRRRGAQGWRRQTDWRVPIPVPWSSPAEAVTG